MVLLLSACSLPGDAERDDPARSPIAPESTASAPASSTKSSTASATPAGSATHSPAQTAAPSAHTATVPVSVPASPSATATAVLPTSTPTPTAITSSNPVTQALLDALPPLDLFPAGWTELIETQADRGFDHSHCRMDPYMALDAYILANGGNLDSDTISDSTGPIVHGTWLSAGDEPTQGIQVSLMDLSAVPIPDAGRVIVEYFLAEGSCATWEREPGYVYTYGEVGLAFPPLGDGGLQWAHSVQLSTPNGNRDGYALVFAVGNRLISVNAMASDADDLAPLQVTGVAAHIAASLSGTAFEPERRALLDALSAAEFPPEVSAAWAGQLVAYPDDGLPHHCGVNLPLPTPTSQADLRTDVRVSAEYTPLAGDRATSITLTLLHLPTAADAQALIAFHETDVTCEVWTADPQQGIEITYAPVEVVVPRLGEEPLWARALTVTSTEGERTGVAIVYAVENRVVFLTAIAPAPDAIAPYIIETITWKLTEALRRFPASVRFDP